MQDGVEAWMRCPNKAAAGWPPPTTASCFAVRGLPCWEARPASHPNARPGSPHTKVMSFASGCDPVTPGHWSRIWGSI